jgi:hypothetical protein
MKKFFGIALVTLLAVSFAFAQVTPYKVGDQNVSAGIGFGMAGIYGDATLPPISVGYETALSALEGKLSVGGILGYAGSKISYPTAWGNWDFNYSYIIIGARGAYHLPLIDNVDTYGGLMLGYNIVSFSETKPANVPAWWPSYSASSSYLAFGAFVGGRYYFTPKLGAYAELGYGLGFLNVGVTYKL